MVALDGSSFTLQTPGRAGGVVSALTATANRIESRGYPYVYGGGHEQAGAASVGIPGPGYNGHRVGFDCSGAVAAVLVGGGLWPAYSGVPADNGIIAQLRQEGKIAPGVGRGPVEVTLYDNPGVHIFMNIDGRFFGTSDGGGAHGGGGWLSDGAPDASSPDYHAYHVLPSVLRSSRSGELFTFQTEGLADVRVGDRVKVSYRESRWGSLVATAVGYLNTNATTGVISAIAVDRSSFTIAAPGRGAMTFATGGALSALLGGAAVGDTVSVTYTRRAATLTARAVVVTATPAPSAGPTAPADHPSARRP